MLSPKTSPEELRIVFSDIIRGYSVANSENYKNIYIKHFNSFDTANIDEHTCKHKENAVKQGLSTEKDKLEFLAKEKLWDAKKDAEIEELKKYVKNLQITKSKLFLKSQIDGIALQIKESAEKINKLQAEREEVVGTTVESYAIKKSNEHYIFLSMCKNETLNQKYFNSEEFEDLNIPELSEIIEAHNVKTENFKSNFLKKIAVSNFFLNFFYLCEDNPFTFYGKPVVNLTYYQVELFGYGRYFKQIFSDSKTRPPEDVMDDPEAIMEWYESTKNVKKAMDGSKQQSQGGSSLVGATKDDLKRLGIVDQHSDSVNLAKEAAKKGGKLNMQDMMKLHGVK